MLVAGVLFLLLPLLVAAVVPASLAFLAGSTGTGLSSYSSGSSSSSSSSPSSSSSTPRAETINHHNMFNRDPFQNRRNSKRAAPLKAIYRFYFLFFYLQGFKGPNPEASSASAMSSSPPSSSMYRSSRGFSPLFSPLTCCCKSQKRKTMSFIL